MDAISLRGGDFKIREKKDISLWCIDGDKNLCVIIIPEASYQLLDSLVVEYSEKHSIPTTIGCKGIDTETPIFMPVTLSLERYHEIYLPLIEYVKKALTPSRELVSEFFKCAEFINKDDFNQTIILKRHGKNFEKGELFTRLKDGKRVEIYVTHLLKTDEPYSSKEINLFKLKNLFRR